MRKMFTLNLQLMKTHLNNGRKITNSKLDLLLLRHLHPQLLNRRLKTAGMKISHSYQVNVSDPYPILITCLLLLHQHPPPNLTKSYQDISTVCSLLTVKMIKLKLTFLWPNILKQWTINLILHSVTRPLSGLSHLSMHLSAIVCSLALI